MTRIVITHPEWGIFLGGFLGLGFFDKLDCAGQTEAATFDNAQDAAEYISYWPENNDPTQYGFVHVETERNWATIAELDAAGLDTTEMKNAALEIHTPPDPGAWSGET